MLTYADVEAVGAAYGYVLYSTALPSLVRDAAELVRDELASLKVNLTVDRIHDRGHVFIDRRLVGAACFTGTKVLAYLVQKYKY